MAMIPPHQLGSPDFRLQLNSLEAATGMTRDEMAGLASNDAFPDEGAADSERTDHARNPLTLDILPDNPTSEVPVNTPIFRRRERKLPLGRSHNCGRLFNTRRGWLGSP